MNIMACSNGNDGYPCQAEFNRKMEHYIVRKKRSERTVVSEGELSIIYNLLSDPAAMRAAVDVSHRTWVKKTFMLKTFANGTFVCHKDKGSSISQPVASKEKMYFILKQAHASEGHGGRDKTAKAVKKTHSFIRKGLICLFLEVCPTCRARNDAVKKDKLANAQNASEAPSPLGHLESASAIESWDQSSSDALRSANPYQSSASSSTFPSTSPLYPPGPEDCLRLTIPVLSTALRRAPSHGVVGTLFPDPGSSHVRSHTFPLLDTSYPSPQPDQYAQTPAGYDVSPSLMSATGSQLGSGYESYNTDHLSELTAALEQQSFCAPIFSVQVDAPGHQPGSSGHEYFPSDSSGHEYFLNDSSGQEYFPNDSSGHEYLQNDLPYFHHEHPSSSSSSSSEAHNQPASNNLFDPANVPYLLSSQPEHPYQSSSASAEFDPFPAHHGSSLELERSASNSSVQAHDDPKDQMLSSAGGPSAAVEFRTYEHMSSYHPVDAGFPETFATYAPQQQAGHRRSFADKNHKNLSLQSLAAGQPSQDGFRNSDPGAFSAPSTAGSMWTTADDLSAPLSAGDFQSLMSSLAAVDDRLDHEDLHYLHS